LAVTFLGRITYRIYCCGLCNALVLICRWCDCGHRYCSKKCSKEARRQNRCRTQADYQRDNAEWKEAHSVGQKAMRCRRRNRARHRRVLERQRATLRRRAVQRTRAAKRMRATGRQRGTRHRGAVRYERATQAVASAPSFGVTDQGLANPEPEINVSVSDPADKEDLGEQPTEARFLHAPICCVFCVRALARFTSTRTWRRSG
jgi:hypothetical protein